MMRTQAQKRRRRFVVWISTVAICGAAVVAPTLIRLEDTIFLGVSVASGLTVTSYVAATAMCVATIRWFSSAPRKARLITVRDLRKRPE